jgi:hypothetical protein
VIREVSAAVSAAADDDITTLLHIAVSAAERASRGRRRCFRCWPKRVVDAEASVSVFFSRHAPPRAGESVA